MKAGQKSNKFHEDSKVVGLGKMHENKSKEERYAVIDSQFNEMRSLSRSNPPWSYGKRMELLNQLELLHTENEEAIMKAIDADFGGVNGGRGQQWSRLADIYLPLQILKHTKLHLKDWMKPEKISASFPLNLMGKSYCMFHPLGVVLCIAPWNFPVMLINGPLAEILAAGNRVVLKPSEHSPETSNLLTQLMHKYFPAGEVVVVQGDYRICQHLTSLPFDHIIFTGSTNIGKLVMKAAADNLVPVTLELGGKSPVFVARDYQIAKAANIIMESKLKNSGQQCNGVDYVIVPKGMATEFATRCAARVRELWGEKSLEENEQYCSIINSSHYERIKGLVSDARNKGANIVSLDPAGIEEYQSGSSSNRFPPILILPPFDPNDIKAMREEIFGPLIPILEMDSVEDVIAFINARDRPLAFYAFTNDKRVKRTLLDRVMAGGVTINEIAYHSIVTELPFGGVGPSGMGAVHGKTGFLSFSHTKAVYEFQRNILPSIALPLEKKDVDQLMLSLKLNVGKITRRCCFGLVVVLLSCTIYYIQKNYEVKILRK